MGSVERCHSLLQKMFCRGDSPRELVGIIVWPSVLLLERTVIANVNL